MGEQKRALNVEQLREIIRGAPPVPGMFEFTMRLVDRIFKSENRIIEVFCKRLGIELAPLAGLPLVERHRAFAASKVAVIRITHSAPAGLFENPEAEFILHQSWCVDLREDPNNRAISWPMVVVTRKQDSFNVSIHDPEGTADLYKDLGGTI